MCLLELSVDILHGFISGGDLFISGVFGDNSTPTDMTYTHIVGKQAFFFVVFDFFSNMGYLGVCILKVRRKECIFERFSTWTKTPENMSF